MHLDPVERHWLARWGKIQSPPDIAVFRVWPLERTHDDDLILGGRCPLCGLYHAHGMSADPHRVPHCSERLPPFREKPKPTLYRLQLSDEPAPSDIRFAMVHRPESANLLHFAALALDERPAYGIKMQGLRDAHAAARRPVTVKMDKARFKAAVQALVDSGIFDERAAMMLEDGARQEGEIFRALVAAFIRRHGPAPIRKRLARALYGASKLVGRGEAA